MKEQILKKIQANEEVVGIIGLGYVGLPLAVEFAEAGVEVLGFDKSIEKVDLVNQGENYIGDVKDEVLMETVLSSKKLSATTDVSRMRECDALIICVPSPLDKYKKPDMSYIEASCIDIGKNMKPDTFVSLESTTYPTTTEDFMLPIIEAESGMKHGDDFWLAYSPERVDPGNKKFLTKNIPKVVGAMTKEGLEIGEALYTKAIDHIHKVSSPRAAEMVKILENTYRLINISLINELALLAGKMDINIWEVIEAASTKPFGFQAFYPGPGIGGHCVPLDPFYLEHIAKKFDFDLSMIHTAGHINRRMPHYMYIKIASALNHQEKAINGSRICFIGVAYKPNINDDRESPALEIMDIVSKKGGIVSYHDPYIPSLETKSCISYTSMPLTAEFLEKADCVVLTTNHDIFNLELIQRHSQLIVDLRNMIKDRAGNVYKL